MSITTAQVNPSNPSNSAGLKPTMGSKLSVSGGDGARPTMLVRVGIWSVLVALIILRKIWWWQAAAIAFAVYVLTGGWQFLYVVIRTLPRDIKALLRYIELQYYVHKCLRTNATVPSEFAENARKYPTKACFIYEDRVWTFKEVDEFSNQVANMFASAGYKKGDVIALFMDSCPEFVGIWLGLSKIGICTALINYSLRLKPLVHSVEVSEAKALIFGSELIDSVKDIQGTLNHGFKYYCYGDFNPNVVTAQSMSKTLEHTSSLPPPAVQTKVTDNLMYIYTSGTTGMPKPAIIHHSRYIFTAIGCTIMMHIRFNDVLYTPLPLYHSAGGMLGIGQALLRGSTVVIRKKFSASKYWDDCIKYNCTVSQYIGEICRYLLSQPEKSTDRLHKVRLMFGNGLRPQIWSQFVKRFGIKEMCEFYGSTEGNANIVNVDSKPNAIGFVSVIAPWLYPVMLIRVDEDTSEPIRGKNGMCIRCKPGEPGEFVGKIKKTDPSRDFLGYVSKSATQKKIVHDVFSKGDTAFLSGDLLVMDEFGYIYFKDRLGDTFRWRGENVSTAEVEAVISGIIGLKDCTVYGVEVPGCEGRAGMAAILDTDGSLDLKVLADGVAKELAAFARPLFVRIVKEVDLTGTYKLRKVDLQKQGIDPNNVNKDKLYYLDASSGRYNLLDFEAYGKICSGKIRL